MDYQGVPLRHELKYYISVGEYYNLVSRLSGIMQRDANAGEKGYFIRSLYFDDMYNTAFNQKEAGDYKRTKFRIRTYNYSDKTGDIKLEKKGKVDQYIYKLSSLITKEQFFDIIDGCPQSLLKSKDQAVLEFYAAIRTRLLEPKVIVDYYRDAFAMAEGNVRITFDKELRAGIDTFDIFDNQCITVPAFPEGKLVMEVKYDNFLPSVVRKIIQPASSEHMAISKYVLCRREKEKMQLRENL